MCSELKNLKKDFFTIKINGENRFVAPKDRQLLKNLIVSIKNNSLKPLYFVTLSVRVKVKDVQYFTPEWGSPQYPYGYWRVDHGAPPNQNWWIFYYRPKIILNPNEMHSLQIGLTIKKTAKLGRYYIYFTLGAYDKKKNPKTWFYSSWKRWSFNIVTQDDYEG